VNQYPNKPVPVRVEVRTLPDDRMLITCLPDPDATGDRWVVEHRDGRVVSLATLVEAALTLVR
jgi:hypothetical protein